MVIYSHKPVCLVNPIKRSHKCVVCDDVDGQFCRRMQFYDHKDAIISF